ncbi:MAG: hypothetical protein ACM3PT_11390 [Deltaproteobacteria bacterium]
MRIFKVFIILIGFALLPQNVKAVSSIDSLRIEINKLMVQLNSRENELINIKKDYNLLNEKIIDTKQSVYVTNNKMWTERFGWLQYGITILAGIFTTLIVWFGFNLFLKKRAKTLFDNFLLEKFKNLKDSDILTLYEEIESAGWKAQLRNRKVLILNQTTTKLPSDFVTALKVFNPVEKKIKEPKDALKIDFSTYSLVILENFDPVGYWDVSVLKDDLVKLADKICAKDTAFIYYGDSRNRFPETNINKHLVNYANSPSQLYNNVMNTLKFQDLLSSN